MGAYALRAQHECLQIHSCCDTLCCSATAWAAVPHVPYRNADACWYARMLLEARLQDCRQRQALSRQLEKLEASVAASIGVAMIYAVPSVTAQPAYMPLLHALAHTGKCFLIPHSVSVHLPCNCKPYQKINVLYICKHAELLRTGGPSPDP